MTLTVCVGASGSGAFTSFNFIRNGYHFVRPSSRLISEALFVYTKIPLGKTTFLNDVYKSHKCTYIRQYHNLRPYIKVSAIPNFDPTKLPYWDIYERENKANTIIVGGTIAGQFMAGLSGGQRKLLIFELIFQRTAPQSDLLIVLDEPFAGVTDDFIPFITDRLNEMRKKHNILLVTNDHVDTLKKMADNTVTVSAIDRTKVKINEREGVDRNLALIAMSIGDNFAFSTNNNDLKFFTDVEFSANGGIPGIAGFTIFAYGMFLLTFWNSQPGSEALVLIAAGIISFFSVNPYLLQLVDWRIFMVEEAEALLHSSKSMNKFLKTNLTVLLILIISSTQFGVMQAVIDTLSGVDMYFAILFDNASLMLAPICLGLYTNLPLQAVQILGAFPFLLMIFFSTTFSPGAGVDGLKNLRYLFSRYYLFCMTPSVDVMMEGCPESNNLLYLILSSLLIVFIFLVVIGGMALQRKLQKKKHSEFKRQSMMTMEYAELQVELFGEKALKKLKHIGSNVDLTSLESSVRSKPMEDEGTSSDAPVTVGDETV